MGTTYLAKKLTFARAGPSWPDSTITVPVSVCHHGSCAETYSRSMGPALLRCRRVDFEIPEQFGGGDMGCLGGPLAFRPWFLRSPGTFAIGRKAAPGKFESKRFCFDNKVITPWHVTFMPISVVLYRQEPGHADSQTALARWRSPYLRYLLETDERGAGLSPCPSRA
jgi:hypothetical protein